jgi:hypothetical protein
MTDFILSLSLLRLFDVCLIISAKDFLPDAKPFDMRMLSDVIKYDRVDKSYNIFREET